MLFFFAFERTNCERWQIERLWNRGLSRATQPIALQVRFFPKADLQSK